MTFSELKFKLKREGSLGTKTFYTVPKVYYSRGNIDYTTLPFVLSVTVIANKKGKRVLSFDNNGFGGDAIEMHFFIDRELADAYTTNLQALQHNKLIDALRDFEYDTKIKTKLPLFLDKFPDVFI